MLEKQRDIVQGRITKKTIFTNISVAIQDDVEQLTEVVLAELKDCISKNLEGLQQDVSTALASEFHQDSEKTESQNELLQSITRLLDEHSRIVRDINSR
jgi:thiamine pyrophosphate-dependent acetolactate synthase large subunit-like protein